METQQGREEEKKERKREGGMERDPQTLRGDQGLSNQP